MDDQPEKQHPQHQLVKLEPLDMHGPIEVIIAVYVKLPDQRVATLNFRQLAGNIPTRSEIKATMDACLIVDSDTGTSLPAGTRLLTKPEFVAHYTKKETGFELAMPGNQSFVPASCEIPKEILIDAIRGAGAPKDAALKDDYMQRGLAFLYGGECDDAWNWNPDTLAALPDDILLALYRRITA